jgi:ribulose-phosphate 3-epimerase
MTVTPAILPHSFEELQEKLSRVEGLTNRVQIDLCDGVVGREKTWLPEGNETLPSGFSYEFDLMVTDWKLYAMRAMTIGASCIVAHVDDFSDEQLQELVSLVAVRNVPLGIAVSNDATVDVHADFVRKAKALYGNVFIQVMGIAKIGEQGQVFDETAVERVRFLKQQFGDTKVQVDGGMTAETAQKVANAGTEIAVAGSFIFNGGDPAGSLSRLSSIEAEASV